MITLRAFEEPGAEPKPGDMSVCFSCEALLEYQLDASAALEYQLDASAALEYHLDASAALSFRVITDAESAALPDEVLLSLLDAVEAARMLRKCRAIIASTRPNQHELH